MTLPLAVFASGRGSNLEALLQHQAEQNRWQISLLITDRSDAGAITVARDAGISAHILSASEESPGSEIMDVLEANRVEGILLAGYLRLVPPAVTRQFSGRILNIHPSLLPAFGGRGMYGRRVHEAVIAAGARLSGVTIHLVDEEYDRGPIVAQWPVPVLLGDSPETLAGRIQTVEHRLFPWVVDRCSERWEAGESAAPLPVGRDAFPIDVLKFGPIDRSDHESDDNRPSSGESPEYDEETGASERL